MLVTGRRQCGSTYIYRNKTMGNTFSSRDKISDYSTAAILYDLIELWLAGFVGVFAMGIVVAFVSHGAIDWECEEHFRMVSGAYDLGLDYASGDTSDVSVYEC